MLRVSETDAVDQEDSRMKARRWMVGAAAMILWPTLAAAQENTFQQGLEALANRDYDLAISCFNEEIRQHPREAVAFANRGNAFVGKGELDKAIADFSQAIRLNPSDSHAFTNRGYAYDARGEYDRAIADYNQALKVNPKDSDAYYNRGNAYRIKGNFEQAVLDYTESLRLHSKFALAYNSRGTAYHELKDYKRAVADFGAAIQINPKLGRDVELERSVLFGHLSCRLCRGRQIPGGGQVAEARLGFRRRLRQARRRTCPRTPQAVRSTQALSRGQLSSRISQMQKTISNIEQGISNVEVSDTSKFDIPCSTFDIWLLTFSFSSSSSYILQVAPRRPG